MDSTSPVSCVTRRQTSSEDAMTTTPLRLPPSRSPPDLPAARPTAGSTTSSPWSTSTPTSPTTRTPTGSIDNVLVYDAARLRDAVAADGRGGGRRPSWCGRSPTGPGIVVLRGAFPDPAVVDRATAAFDAMIADAARRRAARPGTTSPSPGANDRVWNALEKLAVRDPRRLRRLLRQRHDRAGLDGLARARLPGHLAGQRRPPGRPAAGPAPRLPPRLPVERRRRAVPDPRAPALARADAAGRGRALGHARRERADDVPAVLPPVRRPATSPGGGRSSASTSSSTTCSCRWPRATRRSSTRRCSTAPAPTTPPTSSGSPTCSRSRRRSAARWRPWTAARPARRSTRRWSPARHAGVDARRSSTTRSRRPPRATRSRPTSTATSPSTG